jgi:hypothetical protein
MIGPIRDKRLDATLTTCLITYVDGVAEVLAKMGTIHTGARSARDKSAIHVCGITAWRSHAAPLISKAKKRLTP